MVASPDYYTAQDVAARLRVTDRQVHRLCRAGRIPHVRHGKLIRVPVAAWEAWQARMTEEALAAVKGVDHAA